MAIAIWSLLFIVAIGFFGWQIYGRFAVLLKLRRDDNRDYGTATFGKRIYNTLLYAFGQFKFFRDGGLAGILHIIVFWGFVTLGLQVVTMFTRGWFPEFH